MAKIPREIDCCISSCIKELHCADALTERVARMLSLSQEKKTNLAIAVTEAVGNAIVHGNKENPQKKVRLKFKIKPKEIEIIIRDEGAGFDPDTLASPLHPENLMKESGRGIFILKELMDQVDFNISEKGTELRMVMKL